jgi:hypothetical protein
MQQTIVADYADDKVILSINEDPLSPHQTFKYILTTCLSGTKNGE